MQQRSNIPTMITYTQEDGTKNVFIRNEFLGRGEFAIVYRVRHQNTNETYAMKIISKSHCTSLKDEKLSEYVKNEIDIQSSLNHLNIVKSKYFFSDDFNYYIVLEYCSGKNIREYLQKSDNGRLKEPDTRKILKNVIQGLFYLHSQEIIHYDIKLDNFIIDSNGDVKIADFGLSFRKNDKREKFTLLGSPNFLSPEIIRKDNRDEGYKSDIWAIGVCAFILLTGKCPFEGDTFENISKCRYNFPQKVPISNEAKDFINSIFQEEPSKRPTAKELLNHPFLTKIDKEKVSLYKTNHLPQLNRLTKPIQKVQILEKNNAIPQIFNPYSSINYRVQSPRPSNIKEKVSYRPSEKKQLNIRKMFVIPNHFISRYYFYHDNLCYLLGNGTVGANFKDKSRIVLDPNEKFFQFYNNPSSNHEVIDLNNNIEKIESQKKKNIVLFILKIAQKFKSIKGSIDMVNNEYDPTVPLHNIKYFVKNEDSILFKFNDKNIQVNFSDYMKMIIFWDTKKICYFRNINEKCSLLDLKYVAAMNPNTEEHKKFRKSKELLSNLALTI